MSAAGRSEERAHQPEEGLARTSGSLLVRAVARLMGPALFVVSIAVLVKGYTQPGDGFSAGAIAALGLLLRYIVFGREEVEQRIPITVVVPGAMLALLGALAIAAVGPALGDPLFTHYPPAGADVVAVGTLELTTAVAFDVALYLAILGAAAGIVHAISAADDP
ncbi:MAG TPA: MnhB domain-containing protein, partial [Solirubrobacteraceae bacterium]|nr:MnhB domain-containing protein [Solirubrobacteraceae bacterium]